MKAETVTLFDVFNGIRIFEIPFFQRPYVWDETEWERLKEDIEELCKNSKNAKPYFLGSIILKQKNTSLKVKGELRVVIDGQQRLTTLSILLKVLCLKVKSKNEKSTIMDNFNRHFRLHAGNIAIQHNYNDVDAYNKIMNLEKPDPINSKDKISRAYQYFLDNINLEEDDFDTIGLMSNFVGIYLDPEEDEQQIFDTINSLGVRLTTAELLKNYFFARNNVKDYKENWRSVFEKDEDTRAYWDTEIVTGRYKRTLIDVFFFSFLQIKIQDDSLKITTEDKSNFAKVDRLFESYKNFIRIYLKGEQKSILSELKDYAEVFRKTFNTDILDKELPKEAGTERMNALVFALETSTLIPYILFVERKAAASEKAPLYEYLESYIMRRLVTKMSSKNYNNVFYESLILKNVLTADLLKKYFSEQKNTDNRMPNDAEIKEAFHTSCLTNKQALGVLYMIESKIRDRAMYSTQLLGINNYSLEHMMPKKWLNHWKLNNPKITAADRDNALLTLGNLTIITQKLNSSISDADWDTKKNGTPGRNNKTKKWGLLKYAEGIETLFDVLKKPEWDEDGIYERAEKLSQKALEIWKYGQ